MSPPIVIERLKLSARTYNALLRAGIETVEQLRKLKNFTSVKGIRERGAEEIRIALMAYKPSTQRS
jgi:DNA-directed RNA polymerase alpha subunit